MKLERKLRRDELTLKETLWESKNWKKVLGKNKFKKVGTVERRGSWEKLRKDEEPGAMQDSSFINLFSDIEDLSDWSLA